MSATILKLQPSLPPTPLLPNPELISALEELLKMAVDGELLSLVATGFAPDGIRIRAMIIPESEPSAILGAVALLQGELLLLALDVEEDIE